MSRTTQLILTSQIMTLSALDWSVIAAYFLFTLAVGLGFRKRAGCSMADYFVSGRSFPWWVAGTSMVATTFAADTPLAVTSLVIKHGLAGNWFWWAFALGGMFTVFVYARLWRRTGVLTDVEFIELRYGGPAAAFLRCFRSIFVDAVCAVVGYLVPRGRAGGWRIHRATHGIVQRRTPCIAGDTLVSGRALLR